MITFGTLGPSSTNHALVTRRYIDFHGISGAHVVYFDDFARAVDELIARNVDYVVQCAVHPDAARTIGSHFRSVFVVDTFISPSKELAIVSRKDVANPASLALVRPSTESYADLSRWKELFHENSIPTIAEKVLAGKYDSGLVYLEYVEQHSDILRVDEVIGSPDDAWIVYGRERTYRDRVLAWPRSPITDQFRKLSETDLR